MAPAATTTAPPEEVEDIRLDSPPPAAPQAIYFWEYATDDAVRTWSSGGAETFKAQIEELATGGSTNETDITVAFQELVKSAVEERIPVSDVAELVAVLVELPEAPQLKRIFLHSVWPFENPSVSSRSRLCFRCL